MENSQTYYSQNLRKALLKLAPITQRNKARVGVSQILSLYVLPQKHRDLELNACLRIMSMPPRL